MHPRHLFTGFILFILTAGFLSAQQLDGKPYTPGEDPDIDLYLVSWKTSTPRQTHGSLIEREIFTKGDPLKPPRKGAALKYLNRFSRASLDGFDSTQPTVLKGEQEVLFILSGAGSITAGKKTDELHPGSCVLIPAGLEFTLKNTGAEALTMYLVSEPIPAGFRPNTEILVRDENTIRIGSTTGHWVHIVKQLFSTNDGLGTMQSIITVAFDPMTIGHPHSHVDGTEEIWAAVEGESIAFIGTQIRRQEPGMAYLIPPDGKTPHANINTSDRQVKLFYFARYADHEVRK
jgi:mannose-6-phosphate isomerase-like protein (cupin superfamily)